LRIPWVISTLIVGVDSTYPSMTVLNVVIDSSVLLRDQQRKGESFAVLNHLARSGLITIVLPAIVEREFVTHIIDSIDDGAKKIIRETRAISRCVDDMYYKDSSSRFEEALAELIKQTKEGAERDFLEWQEFCNVKVVHNLPEDLLTVQDAYFNGNQGFKSPKNRDDFPDAFIYRVVDNWSRSADSVHFICGDKQLRDACSSLSRVQAHPDLMTFLSTESVQMLYVSATGHLNVGKAKDLFNPKALEPTLHEQLLNYFLKHPIEAPNIPSDNHQGHLTVIGDDLPPELHFASATYRSRSCISIPFRWQIRADVAFQMSREALDNLPDTETSKVSVQRWSYPLLTVERTYAITVYGTSTMRLDINLDEKQFDKDEMKRALENGILLLDAVSDFELD
jgi:hypothetical protein